MVDIGVRQFGAIAFHLFPLKMNEPLFFNIIVIWLFLKTISLAIYYAVGSLTRENSISLTCFEH